MTIIYLVLFLIFSSISLYLFIIGAKLLKADSFQYNKNRERSISFRNVVYGALSVRPEAVADTRVRAGLAVDTKKRCWVPQGELSAEAISSLFKK